jgi:hypothetical protein
MTISIIITKLATSDLGALTSEEGTQAYPYQPVRLRLSAKSVSQPTVFFSHKKPASSTFSQPDQPKRTGLVPWPCLVLLRKENAREKV